MYKVLEICVITLILFDFGQFQGRFLFDAFWRLKRKSSNFLLRIGGQEVGDFPDKDFLVLAVVAKPFIQGINHSLHLIYLRKP